MQAVELQLSSIDTTMHEIVKHGSAGNTGYSFAAFEKSFLEICESLKRDRRAMAFAMILYDFTDAAVYKMLKDQDYWRALDKLSGRYISIFSFWVRSDRGAQAEGRKGSSHAIDEEAEPDELSSSIMERYFGIESADRMPAILFFQVAEGEVSDAYLIELTARRVEDTFVELEEVIETSISAISRVLEENRENSREIFDLIRRRLAEQKTLRRMLKTGNQVGKPLSLLGKLIAGGG